MTGEIVADKRTVIARVGHDDFELPEGDEISVTRDEQGNVNTATLRWGDSLSVFCAEADERGHEVIVRLGKYVGSTGFGTVGAGDALPEVMPYRFPDD
jgi:hypothetical protein